MADILWVRSYLVLTQNAMYVHVMYSLFCDFSIIRFQDKLFPDSLKATVTDTFKPQTE